MSEALLKQVEELERRLVALECYVYKKGGLARAVREVISKWPGPFTADLIRTAVYELNPNLQPLTPERYSHEVSSIICRLERAGQVIRTAQGTGPLPNIWIRSECPPEQAGKRGSRFGRKDEYESGFRGMVRQAMESLPEVWTI